jgi:hypothetical protein
VQPLGSSQHFMEPEGSLPSSQELSTCTYPDPNQSSPQYSILSLKGLSYRLSDSKIKFLMFHTSLDASCTKECLSAIAFSMS